MSKVFTLWNITFWLENRDRHHKREKRRKKKKKKSGDTGSRTPGLSHTQAWTSSPKVRSERSTTELHPQRQLESRQIEYINQ